MLTLSSITFSTLQSDNENKNHNFNKKIKKGKYNVTHIVCKNNDISNGLL